jgi:N-6 DNA Methylase
MINRQTLLTDLQKLLQRIEADLLERSESTEVPEVPAALHAEYERAAKAERTAQNYEDWRTDTITQAAAAWVLSCVFVRFLEDNSLIDPPKISGPGERLARARDEYELYFRSHPQHTDREYLLSIFEQLAALKGTKEIFGEHNAIRDLPNWISGDAAGELLKFFQTIEASSGVLVHDFTDRNWDTRFLGDLYQDLSEAARKKFALLQTPDFVEEFILDRTLDPAIEEFGLVPQPSGNEETSATRFKMIDPACGSGHFLLGAFPRLLDRWQRKEPSTNIRELTQRALDSIHGVDINPFAVAIARFRLLLAAMKSCGIKRLLDAPAFRIHIACGDSLLHGENRTSTGQGLMDFAEGASDQEMYSHAYPGEDLRVVRLLLMPRSYHCVVANPPYITVKDEFQSSSYRNRFSVCHKKYSIAVPFMQQILQLCVQGGYTGQITANSFMKAEFGTKLITSFLRFLDLTTVIDTSGVYLPGHGTPTTILFIRNRPPVTGHVRSALGLKGEPATPVNPEMGLVWRSIVEQIDQAETSNEFISVIDLPRETFADHPWSIGGGGALELKTHLERAALRPLKDQVELIGIFGMSNADDAFVMQETVFRRSRIPKECTRQLVNGDDVRDWQLAENDWAVFPYDKDGLVALNKYPTFRDWIWTNRTCLGNRVTFSKNTYFNDKKPWWSWHQVCLERLHPPETIAFAFVATHNHFVHCNGQYVFNRPAPIIKLRDDADKNDFAFILTTLNSSAACFWMKQVCFPKGGDHVGTEGARVRRTLWDERYGYNTTGIQQLPLANSSDTTYAQRLDDLAKQLHEVEPKGIITGYSSSNHKSLRALVTAGKSEYDNLRALSISLQEELDWLVYGSYGLTEEPLISNVDALPGLELGHRAFEIVMARRILGGEAQSVWFERHRSIPITEVPFEWPVEYRKVVQDRIELIESNANIGLLEQPEYKRRWNTEPWELQLERALREWLLLRLETYFDFDCRMTDAAEVGNRPVPLADVAMHSVAQLADAARRDLQFMEVGELYRDDPAFDVQSLVEDLVLAESVPHLPILRYKDSGLRKRTEWEKTWDLQRREDAGEAVGTIPVPPKYTSADFISTGGARYWSLRGKLDVPKERWISFPHCEGPDGTLVICWAGYDHLQQAQATSAYYVRVQTEFGGSDDPRLIPLLASLIELLPWLKQWHNEPNGNFDGLRMGDYFEGFVNEEARNLGKTLAEIKAWVPPKKVAKTAAPKSSTKKTSKRKAAEETEPS